MGYTKAEWIVLPIAFLIMLAITLLLRYYLIDKSEKIKRIPFLVITILMVGGEIVKQIRGIIVGYDLWWMPLQFCSTFFVWFSLAEFTKGEFAGRMRNIAFLTTLCLVVAIYLFPRAIMGGACENIFKDFLTAHNFFFHHLAILYFMLCIALERVDIQKNDAKYWIVSMFAYFTVAVIFAYALNTNYFAVLYCPVDMFDFFRVTLGQFFYNAIEGCALIFAPVGVILLIDRLRKGKKSDEPVLEIPCEES